jgi:DNA modification methylase
MRSDPRAHSPRPEIPIRNHTKPGDAVYDLFLGSGTTLIASERHARTCYGFEIDPLYCDVIVARWERFSGRVADRVELVGCASRSRGQIGL